MLHMYVSAAQNHSFNNLYAYACSKLSYITSMDINIYFTYFYIQTKELLLYFIAYILLTLRHHRYYILITSFVTLSTVIRLVTNFGWLYILKILRARDVLSEFIALK